MAVVWLFIQLFHYSVGILLESKEVLCFFCIKGTLNNVADLTHDSGGRLVIHSAISLLLGDFAGVKGGTSFFVVLTSRKLCRFLLIFLTSFTSLSVLLFFPPLITFVFIHSFDSISSNIDEVLPIDPSANAFVFRDFKFHHKN